MIHSGNPQTELLFTPNCRWVSALLIHPVYAVTLLRVVPGHLKDPSGNRSIVTSLISPVIPVIAPRQMSSFRSLSLLLLFCCCCWTFWLGSSSYSRWASARSQCSPCLMYRTSSVMLLGWLSGSITESSSWKNSEGEGETQLPRGSLCILLPLLRWVTWLQQRVEKKKEVCREHRDAKSDIQTTTVSELSVYNALWEMTRRRETFPIVAYVTLHYINTALIPFPSL